MYQQPNNERQESNSSRQNINGADAHESTPLLGDNQSSRVQYNGTTNNDEDYHKSTAEDAIEAQLEDEPAYLAISRVNSIPQGVDVEPNLETIPEGPEERRRTSIESGGIPQTTDYSSRFIDVSPTRFWIVFGGVLVGYILGFFDSTLMASSHPVITSHFHASNAASWLSTAFLLTCTAFMPLFARISDTFGRRPVYLASVFFFFVSTAWCGSAQSIGSFIAARAFCGLGAGGIFSLGMIISSDMVRLEYRGVYQSFLNLALGAGGSLGLAFGGLLCDQIGWRGAFYIQLPFIFVYFLMSSWTLPGDLGLKRPKSERMNFSQLVKSIDLVGSTILIIGVTALIMGLNLGGNVYSWGHPTVISSLVAFCVLAVIFVAYERKADPAVMPVTLLSTNPRSSLIFGNFFGCIAINSVVFNAPLFFQAVKLASPTETGLRLIASSASITTSSVLTGFLITWWKRLKPTVLLGGLVLLLGGLASSTMDNHTPDALAMFCLSVASTGQGSSFPSITVAVLATSEQSDQAIATTTLGLFRNLGSTMGVAASSFILQNTLLYKLEELVTGPNKEDVILLVRKSVGAIADLDPMHKSQGMHPFHSIPFHHFITLLYLLTNFFTVIGAYVSALRTTFFSAAVWGGIMLVMHLNLRLPRLGRKN